MYKLGLTWGVWDLLHIGHTRLLKSASELCEKLYVGVTTDEYAVIKKGRVPVIPYDQRTELLSELPFVAFTFPQSEEYTKAWAVQTYKPDALFVGDDWTPQTYGGEGLGVPVIYLPRTRITDTTCIIKRIKEFY